MTKMTKRPYVQIRGIHDHQRGLFTLETMYAEEGEEPQIERMSCASLPSLNKKMNKCVAYAKKHSYDYDVKLTVL